MTTALIGYTGFVGLNLQQFYKIDFFYNSKNINDICHKEFDTVFFCGIPAVKWLANKNPEDDINIISNIINIIKTIKVNKFILISTIDVYEDTNSEKDEKYNCKSDLNHAYGKHRYIFEKFIESHFINYHIIRLPALFGKGLKKNIIFDLLNNNQINNISVNTSFQWYCLDWLKNDITIILENNIKICNLFPEPLPTIKILNLFHYDILKMDNVKKINYNIKTCYYKLFNSACTGYIRSSDIVEEYLKKYIDFTKINKDNLVVSNICSNNISQLQFSCILKLFGITNVQIAPTMLTTWETFNNISFDIFENNGINVYSMQSITYTLNNLNIFDPDTEDKLFDHIRNVVDVASRKNIKILVFGCPRNRYVKNIYNPYENENVFISFFKKLGDYCKGKNITICIENNSRQYNCNFLNKISEVGEIVQKINNNCIKMMVDLGNIIMENDNIYDIYKYSQNIYNIDISQENMKNYILPNEKNLLFKNILNDINYSKKINLEMLASNLEEICVSIINFINIYGINNL